MRNELNAEDFARAVRNPYFDKLMTKTEVAIKKEDYDVFRDVGKMNNVPAEMIMRNCLADWAKKLREAE